MEGIVINISRLFVETDPKLSIKTLKNITKSLESVENISFPSNLTLCLLSKFSESITNIESPNCRSICKDFLHFFTIYLKKCTFITYKDCFISLLSQGLRISDYLRVGSKSLIDITLLVDYFASIFSQFNGKIIFGSVINGEISLEESLIGATVHAILQYVDDGIKNRNCFTILDNISEGIDKSVATNYYPGICSRLGRFIIRSTNDLMRVYAMESLGLWVSKVMESSVYSVPLRDRINSISNLSEYMVEFDVIVRDNPELLELVTNTNNILQLIVGIRSDNPKVINGLIKFYEKILRNCNIFISKGVHSGIISYLLVNCKYNNKVINVLQSDSRNMVVSRDVLGRSMSSDDYNFSIDLFQGYHHIFNDGVIPLDRFVVFNWLLKLSEQQFVESYNDSTIIERFFKYGSKVTDVITSYYRYHLNESQRCEILESLTESLYSNVIVQEDIKSNVPKWLKNLNDFNVDLINIQHSFLIPFVVNVGLLIDCMEMIPSLDNLVLSIRVIIRVICCYNKQYLDNDDKLLLCNIYYTLNKCNKYRIQLIECGIHSILFDTIHLTCSNSIISSYSLEFMNGLYGDLSKLLSRYSNHLINTCRTIIKSYDISNNNNNNYKLLMAKNVIGFICKFGLECANISLSQFSLDVLDIPIHVRQFDEISLIKPIIIDNGIMEYDEEFVITLLNSVLHSFQKEISRFRDSKRAITNDIKSINVNDYVCDDDVSTIPDDILHPIMPIDSLGKYGMYRRVATAVVARARHAMLLTRRYNLACKSSVSVLLSLYILSTDTNELLPRISEIFPMVLNNINSSIVLSAYAIIILKYCNLLAPEFVKHKQFDIVNQIYQRLIHMELSKEADEIHLSSRFIFQSFALEYLVIVTETKQFCPQVLFKIVLLFTRCGISSKLRELTVRLWLNLRELYPNHVSLLLSVKDSISSDRHMLLNQILGVDNSVIDLDYSLLSELESSDPKISLKIPTRIKLKSII